MALRDLLSKLLELYREDWIERVGFVTQDFEIVEVENICDDAENGFEVKGEDLLKHMGALASWHTHPGQDSHLSTNDFYGFRDYPQWLHIIIGNDGVRIYRVHQGMIEIEEHLVAG